jgi:hypothetical protein
MMEAVSTSETSVDNHFTRQYIPQDNPEHHTRRRENLKSHKFVHILYIDMHGIKLKATFNVSAEVYGCESYAFLKKESKVG